MRPCDLGAWHLYQFGFVDVNRLLEELERVFGIEEIEVKEPPSQGDDVNDQQS